MKHEEIASIYLQYIEYNKNMGLTRSAGSVA
jgi:hypothetical protein